MKREVHPFGAGIVVLFLLGIYYSVEWGSIQEGEGGGININLIFKS